MDSITKAQLAISTPEQVDRLFTFIAALVVKDESEDSRWVLLINILNGF